jgi:hypothetical protein
VLALSKPVGGPSPDPAIPLEPGCCLESHAWVLTGDDVGVWGRDDLEKGL